MSSKRPAAAAAAAATSPVIKKEKISVFKEETDDEEEVAAAAAASPDTKKEEISAFKEETDDEEDAATAAATSPVIKALTLKLGKTTDDESIISALKPGSDDKRLLKLKEEGEAKRRDQEYQNTFLWCENVRDTFLILSQNKYDLWHAVKTSKTWGELRARVSKKFYEDEVEFRILVFPEKLVNEKFQDIYDQPVEDEDPFDPNDLCLIGQSDLLSWEHLFPDVIERIVRDGRSSWEHWLQKQRKESVYNGLGFPEYVHRMEDKDKILEEAKKRGLQVKHAPELATLSETVMRYEKQKEEGYDATWEKNEGDKLSSYEDWIAANDAVADYWTNERKYM